MTTHRVDLARVIVDVDGLLLHGGGHFRFRFELQLGESRSKNKFKEEQEQDEQHISCLQTFKCCSVRAPNFEWLAPFDDQIKGGGGPRRARIGSDSTLELTPALK